jgi:hypothetical protein
MTPNTVSPALTTVSVVHVPQALTAAKMTLRDYFAAKAMEGWVASSPVISGEPINGSAAMAEQIAVASFILADAMLKEREQK